MNRYLGLPTGLVALIALVMHIRGLGGSKDSPAASPGNLVDGKADSSSASRADIVDPTEGPWLATQAFFGLRALGPLPENPAKRFNISDPDATVLMIATVPDPFHTRLALFTDNSIQAIQQGLAALDWEFANQWLPWIDTLDSSEKNPEKRRTERASLLMQQCQPGLLVFRRRILEPKKHDMRVLLVFVVGETPVGGINRKQFQLARDYMRAINDCAPVRILGPTFSGSFPSLTKLIHEDKKLTLTPYSVVSGTATVERSFQYIRAGCKIDQ